MNAQRRDEIYNRILELKLKVDIPSIPNPRILNEKLGECRVQMEEIERFSIETYQALSVMQQAFNTAEAEYETKKEHLLANDSEIINLPNIKDREAKVNSKLKVEIATIRQYKNEIHHLNYLLKALSVKSKNLNTINADIKSHIRIMESQIKLIGNGSLADPAVQSLMEEFKKSRINQDAFEDAETTVTENNVIDPSTPVDINNLLSDGTGDGLEDLPIINPPSEEKTIDDNLLNPEPELDPENKGIAPELAEDDNLLNKIDESPTQPEPVSEKVDDNLLKSNGTEPDQEIKTEEMTSTANPIIPEPTEESEDLPFIDENPFEGLDFKSDPIYEDHSQEADTLVDLDQIIDFTSNEGGPTQEPINNQLTEVKSITEVVVQKQETEAFELDTDTGLSNKTTPISSGLDLDALLDDLNLTKE